MSPRAPEPTAARQISVAANAGGGGRGDTTATREATLREDSSSNVGVTGRRGAAVPVQVDPDRGQPDQTRGAGESRPYHGGESGIEHDRPPPRLALKHTATPLFCRKKPVCSAWTRHARYYAEGVGFPSAFVSDPSQYISVEELDTKGAVRVLTKHRILLITRHVT